MSKKSKKSTKVSDGKVSKNSSANNSIGNVSSQSLDRPLKPILSKKNSRDSSGFKNVTFQGESAKKRNSLGSKNVSVTEEIDSDDDVGMFPLNLTNSSSENTTSDNMIEIDSEDEDSVDYEFLVDSSASDVDDSDDDDILGSLWAGVDDDESDESDKKLSTVVFEEITEEESFNKTSKDIISTVQITNNQRTSLKRKRFDDSPVSSPSNKRVLTEKQTPTVKSPTGSKTYTKNTLKSKFQEKLAQLKKEGKTITKKDIKKLKKTIKAQERKKKKTTKPKVTISAHQAEKILESTNKRLQELQSRSIYIRPVPKKCDYSLLNEAFPDMTGCHIPLKLASKKNKVPRGFTFVEFSTTEQANKHLKQCANADYMQHILKVLYPTDKARPSQLIVKTACPREIKTSKNEINKTIGRYNLTKLHVSGLPAVVDNKQLRAIFKDCKRIEFPNRKNNHFGFCVVEYSDESEAKHAFWNCHGKNLNDAPLTVTLVINRRKKV